VQRKATNATRRRLDELHVTLTLPRDSTSGLTDNSSDRETRGGFPARKKRVISPDLAAPLTTRSARDRDRDLDLVAVARARCQRSFVEMRLPVGESGAQEKAAAVRVTSNETSKSLPLFRRSRRIYAPSPSRVTGVRAPSPTFPGSLVKHRAARRRSQSLFSVRRVAR